MIVSETRITVKEAMKRMGAKTRSEAWEMLEEIYFNEGLVPVCCNVEDCPPLEIDGECPHGNPSILRASGMA